MGIRVSFIYHSRFRFKCRITCSPFKYLEKLDEACVEFEHTHLNYEIYYILEGRMRMRID